MSLLVPRLLCFFLKRIGAFYLIPAIKRPIFLPPNHVLRIRHTMSLPKLTIILAAPRGFCAGVDRAIHIVDKALEKHGAPVYVRHEIVHNRYVVDGLRAKGAVFVEELDEIPEDVRADVPVIFSAHGVAKSVFAAAEERGMGFLDATCPLVTKVHKEAEHHNKVGRRVILIGHEGHPEVVGTMGQLPEGEFILVEDVEQAKALDLPKDMALAYTTQTTLSTDETAEIIAVLKERFPHIRTPRREDICYATTNRQQAVKAIAPRCDMLMVIGAPNSSNSKRLVEVAALNGCPLSMLVQRAAEIQWDLFGGVDTLGISAGASAPEVLVDEVISACRERFSVTVEMETITEETLTFKLPPELRSV